MGNDKFPPPLPALPVHLSWCVLILLFPFLSTGSLCQTWGFRIQSQINNDKNPRDFTVSDYEAGPQSFEANGKLSSIWLDIVSGLKKD